MTTSAQACDERCGADWPEVTATAAHRVEPGAIYIVEVDGHPDPAQVRAFRDKLNETAGATFVVMVGAHLVSPNDDALDDLIDAIERRQKQRERSA